MCERLATDISSKLLVDIFGLEEISHTLVQDNIAPSQKVPVIRRYADGQNHLDYLQWGLIPSWTMKKDISCKMFNTRSETLIESPASREAVMYRRCLVLASGFYQKAEKGLLYFSLKGSTLIAFAGLWDAWKSEGKTVESCTILTTGSNQLVGSFHNRMPVILHSNEYQTWLDRGTNELASLMPMFNPYPSDLMEMTTISPSVNISEFEYYKSVDHIQETASHILQKEHPANVVGVSDVA